MSKDTRQSRATPQHPSPKSTPPLRKPQPVGGGPNPNGSHKRGQQGRGR